MRSISCQLGRHHDVGFTDHCLAILLGKSSLLRDRFSRPFSMIYSAGRTLVLLGCVRSWLSHHRAEVSASSSAFNVVVTQPGQTLLRRRPWKSCTVSMHLCANCCLWFVQLPSLLPDRNSTRVCPCRWMFARKQFAVQMLSCDYACPRTCFARTLCGRWLNAVRPYARSSMLLPVEALRLSRTKQLS